MFNNPLTDKQFLKNLDKNRNRDIYIKLIALNRQELPTEELEGRATSGSISIDGNSAIRRTCSLSLVAENVNITDYYWTLNSKFKVFIGLKNTIDTKKYPDIIWFPQGVYIITSFSTSVNANSYSINISGKDKMCMLNGENGGLIQSSMVLDTATESPNALGQIETIQIPISTIIFNLVNQIGGEKIQNIIIEDLAENSYNLLEYQASTPLYFFKDKFQTLINLTIEDLQCWIPTIERNEESDLTTVISWEQSQLSKIPFYDSLGGLIQLNATWVSFDEEKPITGEILENYNLYTIIKIESGQTIGYEEIEELYYPKKGSLTANIGENITTVLDKIKKVLGEFEYYYDLDGKFIFKEKDNYLQSSWTPVNEYDINKFYITPLNSTNAYSYSFEGCDMLTSISNSPKIDNIKNDYCIWGQRQGVSNSKVPIHIRCAIDNKPEYYYSPWFRSTLPNFNTSNAPEPKGKAFVTQEYIDSLPKEEQSRYEAYDWRELIYQMAIDYTQYHNLPNFLYIIRSSGDNKKYYPNGITGYEQYYIELEGFWRQLYNPFYDVELSSRETENNKILVETYLNTEGKPEFSKDQYFTLSDGLIKYWNKKIITNPENLNFWFDFFEFSEGQEFEKYNVSNIGSRPKVANDNAVTSIYYRNIPNVLLVTAEDQKTPGAIDPINGWVYLQITQEFRDQYLSVSSQGKSASNAIAEYLYQYTNAADTISISCVPIYYLQPNTKIWINDQDTGIKGEYIINKLTIPLSYNGIMSISATKVIQSIN